MSRVGGWCREIGARRRARRAGLRALPGLPCACLRPCGAASLRPVRTARRQRAAVQLFHGHEKIGHRLKRQDARPLSDPAIEEGAGSAMTYDGVAYPKDRSDLIAYLKHVNDTTECGKQARLHPR